jgi:mercuric ion binding protein
MIKNVFIFIAVCFLVTVISAEAIEENVVIEIEGMTCRLCPLAIKKSLLNIEGVVKAEVSLKDQTALVTVNKSVSNEALVEALKKAGPYKGRIVERYLRENDVY